jgi:hypothetical protein
MTGPTRRPGFEDQHLFATFRQMRGHVAAGCA